VDACRRPRMALSIHPRAQAFIPPLLHRSPVVYTANYKAKV